MTDNLNLLLDQLRPYLPAHLAQKLVPEIDALDFRNITQRIRSVRNVLSTYLPRYLVEAIQMDPTPGKVSGGFRDGAVLFADVSGFTAMSRKLSALGKEGAEEITGIVNNYFTAMLDISESFGGDLLKFGGDALLIFFDGETGPIRSLAAGHAMQSAMNRFSALKTSQGVFPLQMKIGIASGSIFMANLGTPKDMDYAVLGRTLTEMAEAETIANPGQIVVSDRVRQATDRYADHDPIRDGFWMLKSLNIPKDLLRKSSTNSFTNHQNQEYEIPIQVEECLQDVKIIAGLGPFVPEELLSWIITDPKRLGLYNSHRPVTVMFANFYGIEDLIDGVGTAYPDTVTQILNTHYVTMSEVNSQYGGTINRLDTYTKGNRFLMVFGALRAHEDDPQRAVRTALEMNRRLAEVNRKVEDLTSAIPALKGTSGSLKLKQRIGVNSGFVFAGNTGSGTRREYTVMGDQVNLTARLMGIAQDGEVLIGQSTARQLGTAFNLEEKERVMVKGLQEPIRNILVRGVRESSRRKAIQGSGVIAGRDGELQLGKSIVDKTLQGNGAVLIIKGTSGIGKTRLTEEIVFYGKEQGMDLLIGTCLSYGNTMTYHPWAELLRAYFGIEGPELSQNTAFRMETIQREMDAINEGLWTPVIGTVMGLGIPDNDITRDMDPQLRRQRVLDLTLKLLITRARRLPLMVVVEDTHWADPASLDLIDYVSRNLVDHPVLLILPYRPDEGLPDWSVHPHASSLELGDLPRDASIKIIRDLLGDADLPEPVYDIILNKGGGNPFFIAEVVRALIDSGALQPDAGGVWQVSRDMSTVDLPDTIHGVILSRIDRLLATHRRILQVASVIGRIFDYPTLDGVYPYADVEKNLRNHLNSLNDFGLTELQAIEREIYRFIHLTTREVVYGSLSFEHRRSLHREIGGFVERTSIDSLSEQTDLLAYHYYEGHAWVKAMDYNLATARHAQREFANETAILSGQRALEAATNLGPEVDTRPERISAHEILGEVLTLVGRYDQALEHCNLARKILESPPHLPGRSRQLAEVCRKIAAVYERRSEYDASLEWLGEALNHIEEIKPTVEASRIYILKAGVFYRQGKFDEAIHWCLRTLSVASQIRTRTSEQVEAQAYYNLGQIYTRRGDMEKSVQYCNQSIQIYQEIDDALGQARAYNNLAIAYTDQGDWAKASEVLAKSLAINQRIGNIQEQGFIANNLANIYLYRGEWDQAEKLYKQSNTIWRQVGAVLPEAVVLSNLAQVFIYKGDLDAANEALNRSQTLFNEVGSEDFLPELERRWGEYYLKKGDLDQALNHANQSIRLAEAHEARLEMGISYRILGEIRQARGEYGNARTALQRSLALLSALNSEYEAAKTMLALALLADAAGENLNRKQLKQAMDTFTRLGAQADLKRGKSLSEYE